MTGRLLSELRSRLRGVVSSARRLFRGRFLRVARDHSWACLIYTTERRRVNNDCTRSVSRIIPLGPDPFDAARDACAAFSPKAAEEKQQILACGARRQALRDGQQSPTTHKATAAPRKRARNRGSSWPSGPAAAARLIQMVLIAERRRRRRQLVERTGSAWNMWTVEY